MSSAYSILSQKCISLLPLLWLYISVPPHVRPDVTEENAHCPGVFRGSPNLLGRIAFHWRALPSHSLQAFAQYMLSRHASNDEAPFHFPCVSAAPAMSTEYAHPYMVEKCEKIRGNPVHPHNGYFACEIIKAYIFFGFTWFEPHLRICQLTLRGAFSVRKKRVLLPWFTAQIVVDPLLNAASENPTVALNTSLQLLSCIENVVV